MKRLVAAMLSLILMLLPCMAVAEESPGAQDAYRARMGFSARNPGTTQLGILVHDVDSWRAGATDRPTEFYLNILPQNQLTGGAQMDIVEAVQRYTLLSFGLTVYAQGDSSQLVVSDRGVKGVRSYDLLRSAGPGYDALVAQAAELLGYRPGDMNFAGKHSVRAELAWPGDSIVLADPATLAQLDDILAACTPCAAIDGPFNAFLTLNFADGDSAGIALSTDGAAACFYRGVYFRYDGELRLPGLFGLTDEAFHILTNGESADA